MSDRITISRTRFQAAIFDLDGVLTDTAATHRAAWKEVFDELLRRSEGEFRPFTAADYRRWVDGKPRLDGIRSFLESRSIELPEGRRTDPPGLDTIQAVGAEKNKRYRRRLADGELDVFDESIDLLDRLATCDFRLGMVSSSRNAGYVMDILGIADRFEAAVDGNTLAELDLAGKPAPDLFLEAARRLDTAPPRSVVVEDATSGVEAGRAGGFGLVIGLSDDSQQRRELLDAGADVALRTLADVEVTT